MALNDDLELVESEEGACVWLYFRKYPKGFVCPCGSTKLAPQHDIRFTECGDCGRRESITAHTLYHRSRKPLSELAELSIKFFEGVIITATQAAQEMEWNYNAAWRWMQKLRDSPEGKIVSAESIEIERETLGSKLSRRSTESEPKQLEDVPAGLDSGANHDCSDDLLPSLTPAWSHSIVRLVGFLGQYFHCCVSAKHLQRYINHFWLLFCYQGSREELLIACIRGKPKRSVEAYSSPNVLMVPMPP